MSFVYRYIDPVSNKTIYIGKVKGEITTEENPLIRRHSQHRRDSWYHDELILAYIECSNHCDADILETYFISKYNTEYLKNVQKADWGISELNISDKLNWKILDDTDYLEDKVNFNIRNLVAEILDSFYLSDDMSDFDEDSEIIRNNIDSVIKNNRNYLKELALRKKENIRKYRNIINN